MSEKLGDAQFPWIAKENRVPNHFYLYGVDADFGPFVIKFCSYFPYNGRVIINGHEYAKRQAAKRGIAFEELDNGFAAGEQRRLQRVCDSMTDGRIDAFVRKWLRRLPNPFTVADRKAGFDYKLSILQIELSLTQVLDSARAGRAFFDDVIRHNLDLGRPDRVGLIFDRQIRRRGKHPTPGQFRTRVITEGVTPSLHIDFKHSKIKQYHKLGVALRTETTVNNTTTSASAVDCTTSTPCVRSASPPTGVCSTSNEPATTRSSAPPAYRSLHRRVWGCCQPHWYGCDSNGDRTVTVRRCDRWR